MNQVQDDEVDLFVLFQTLWDGKWLISAFVAIALLLGGGSLSLKDAVYASRLIYVVDTIPPFYEEDKALVDFQKKFYSMNVFEGWKKSNVNASVVFEDFSDTRVVNGFVMSKGKGEQVAIITSEIRGGSFVLVKSNNLLILDDFFKYVTHINGLLKTEYVLSAHEELETINRLLKGVYSLRANEDIVANMLATNRYIALAEKGANVLAVQRPTMPTKVSPKSFLTLAMSVVLGGMVGVFFILVRNAVRKRKEQLVKA